MRNFIMIGLAVGLDLGAFTARGDLEVSATVSIHAAADFYAPLAPSGTWRETRTVGSSGPQKVVINQGPGLAAVQSASGKTIKAIPIREAARQARVPAGLSRGTGEWKSKDKPGFAPAELPKSALERKPPPGLAKPEGTDLGSLGRKDAGKRHEQEGEHHGRD